MRRSPTSRAFQAAQKTQRGHNTPRSFSQPATHLRNRTFSVSTTRSLSSMPFLSRSSKPSGSPRARGAASGPDDAAWKRLTGCVFQATVQVLGAFPLGNVQRGGVRTHAGADQPEPERTRPPGMCRSHSFFVDFLTIVPLTSHRARLSGSGVLASVLCVLTLSSGDAAGGRVGPQAQAGLLDRLNSLSSAAPSPRLPSAMVRVWGPSMRCDSDADDTHTLRAMVSRT